MKVLSYNWPREYVETHPGVVTDPWDMDSVGIVCVLPIQGTDEQKRVWRERGKVILHTVYANPLLATDDALLTAMLEASKGECDGVSLDEILLGTLVDGKFERLKRALKQYRDQRPGKIIHVWIGNTFCSPADRQTVNLLYRMCYFVSPEIYRSEEGRLDFEDWLVRYGVGRARRNRTLIGIVTHTDPRWRKSDAGWLPNMQRQIAEIRRLRVGGAAMWAPCHLRNSEERKQLDELLK